MFSIIRWILLVLCMPQWSFSQANSSEELTLMFYNAENLFDVRDDSVTLDEAFLPEGERHWTYGRLQQKLSNLYKVVAGVGEWDPPALIAFAEVENRYVLQSLLTNTPLHRYHYQVIHQESCDRRGIDVAVLYREDMFALDYYEFIEVELPDQRTTRDILYVRGQLPDQDLIHMYVNHWPSRYSGTKVSEASRKAASQTLHKHVQQLLATDPTSKILITGDFNDTPQDASVASLIEDLPIQNLSDYAYEGTHKHQGTWSVLDQWLASESWQAAESDWVIEGGRGQVFHPDWLLEEDEANLGYRPKRTYVGFRYQGGFSDHLPIYVRLVRSH